MENSTIDKEKTEVKKCYIYSTWLGEIEVSIEK